SWGCRSSSSSAASPAASGSSRTRCRRSSATIDPRMRAKARRCVVVGALDIDGLRAAGLEVVTAAGADEALRAVAQAEPEALVVELELPGKDGRWLLRRLRDDFMGTRPRVYLYARPEAMLGDVPELGADAVILKPADAALLASA